MLSPLLCRGKPAALKEYTWGSSLTPRTPEFPEQLSPSRYCRLQGSGSCYSWPDVSSSVPEEQQSGLWGNTRQSSGFLVGLSTSGHMSTLACCQSRMELPFCPCPGPLLVLGLANDEQVRDSQSYIVSPCLEKNQNPPTIKL